MKNVKTIRTIERIENNAKIYEKEEIHYEL